MIDYARQNMCDYYVSTAQTASAPLDAFSVLKKGNASFTYGNLYDSYSMCSDPEAENSVYYNMINFRDYRHDADGWKSKVLDEWNCDDTVAWIYDCAVSHGFCEFDVPFHNFRLPGHELRNKRHMEIVELMAHPHVDPQTSTRIANMIYDRLQCRLNEDMRSQSVLRYAESSPSPYPQIHEPTVLTDLSYCTDRDRGYYSDYKTADISLMNSADSSDEPEDTFRIDAASPACSYGSDGSKSGDEDDKKKPFKRPPGRPKGSVKKDKRPRSVSVPQFLRDLLLDERFNPSIIKWEDISQGKFRFVKPDEVAKLWGQMKQNDNMTFEKFSRAMRYHYQHCVLVSVPTARLVYQFGPKGPDYKTNNPHFVKVKTELESPNYS